MTIREFVEDLYNSCRESAQPLTVEQAAEDIENFKRESWDIPDGITAEEYAEIWNELVKGDN